jgi:Na+/H+ antiporter NhaD/arsenite permease-like protein
MTPVTLSVARRLGIPPWPYLISQILASNIGGTATLIGDPPNILIGSAAGLDFGDFLLNLGPIVLVILGVFVVAMVVLFGGHLQVPDERREAALEATEETIIRDRGLLVRTLIVVALTIAGFLANSALGLENATIALLGGR